MKQNILIVDDESQILMALKRTLRNQEYNVLTANDGHEALAILKDNTVSLIVSDYMMPGLSGTELLTQAEEIQPDSIRIILSGHSDFQNVMDSIKSGTVHKFLAKPWSNEVLISQINKSLESLSGKQEDDSESDSSKTKNKSRTPINLYKVHTDLEGQIESISSDLMNFFGYGLEDVKDQPFSMLISDRSYQQHLAYVEDKGGSTSEWNLPAQTRIAQTSDNKFFPIALSVKKSTTGLVYKIGVIENKVAKKDNAKEIKDAYLQLNEKGEIEKFNQKFTELFGGIIKPSVGVNLRDFLSECIENGFYPEAEFDQDEWLDNFLKFDTRFDEAHEYEFKDEQLILVTATKATDNSVILIYKIQNFDIEKVLDKALDAAKNAVKEKEEMINRINEEVSEPMKNLILVPLSKLKDIQLDLNPEQQEYLDLAFDSSASILSDLSSITGAPSSNTDDTHSEPEE